MAQSVNVKKLTPEVSRWMLDHVDLSLIREKDKKRDLAYLQGERGITLKQLESLSRRVHIPVSYFLVSTPPEEEFPIMQYRTVDLLQPENPSRELIDTITRMEWIQDWIKDERTADEMDSLEVVGSISPDDSVMTAARQVRNLLDLSLLWFHNRKKYSTVFSEMRDKIGHWGITVILDTNAGHSSRPLLIEEFRAFAMCDDQAPVIFINANDTIGAQLFSLIHEFVHICIGSSDLFNGFNPPGIKEYRRKEEQFCNAIAAEILVPSDNFAEIWKAAVRDHGVTGACSDLVSSYYKCSMVVVARRALDRHYIFLKDYRAIEETARKKAYAEAARKKEELRKKAAAGGGGINPNAIKQFRLSKRFVQMVADSITNGRTTYTEAFRLTGTTSNSFFNLLKAAGIHGYDQ